MDAPAAWPNDPEFLEADQKLAMQRYNRRLALQAAAQTFIGLGGVDRRPDGTSVGWVLDAARDFETYLNGI